MAPNCRVTSPGDERRGGREMGRVRRGTGRKLRLGRMVRAREIDRERERERERKREGREGEKNEMRHRGMGNQWVGSYQ